LFIFVACFTNIQAQFIFGTEAGLLRNELIGFGKPANPQPRTSILAGFFTDYYISEQTSVFTEYRYERRGFIFDDTIPYLNESKIHVEEYNDCISVPVHLKFRAGDDIYNSFLLFGAEFSVPFWTHQVLNVTIQDLAVDGERYTSFKHNRFDYGLTTGFGLQLNSFYTKFGIYYGLGNFYQGRNIMEIRNAYGYITVGAAFNYDPPQLYRKSSPIKNLKYRLKKAFR